MKELMLSASENTLAREMLWNKKASNQITALWTDQNTSKKKQVNGDDLIALL